MRRIAGAVDEIIAVRNAMSIDSPSANGLIKSFRIRRTLPLLILYAIDLLPASSNRTSWSTSADPCADSPNLTWPMPLSVCSSLILTDGTCPSKQRRTNGWKVCFQLSDELVSGPILHSNTSYTRVPNAWDYLWIVSETQTPDLNSTKQPELPINPISYFDWTGINKYR